MIMLQPSVLEAENNLTDVCYYLYIRDMLNDNSLICKVVKLVIKLQILP